MNFEKSVTIFLPETETAGFKEYFLYKKKYLRNPVLRSLDVSNPEVYYEYMSHRIIAHVAWYQLSVCRN
jgi:hypothetical protein